MDQALIDRNTINEILSYSFELAKINHIEFDWSEKSVAGLDKLLDALHHEYTSQNESDEEALSGVSLSLGVYLGEYIRRFMSRQSMLWYYGKPNAGGPPTPYISNGEIELYPIDWVHKHILEGSEESVQSKVRILIEKYS